MLIKTAFLLIEQELSKLHFINMYFSFNFIFIIYYFRYVYECLQQSAENSGSSTSSSGSNYGTLGRGQSGMASMMDEMAKTLARRRAAAEKKDPVDTPLSTVS